MFIINVKQKLSTDDKAENKQINKLNNPAKKFCKKKVDNQPGIFFPINFSVSSNNCSVACGRPALVFTAGKYMINCFVPRVGRF